MSEQPKSFFHTFTGIITALASLIVAITGLYAATDGFNFSANQGSPQAGVSQGDTEQEQLKQLQALKRQKEIDDLRIQQQKQALLAQQEIEKLKAELKQGQQTNQITDSSYPPPTTFTTNITGLWVYTNQLGTFTFALEQHGNQITLQEYDAYNNQVGTGNGMINGHQVNLSWEEPIFFISSIEVEASLILGSDGNTLIGTMYTEDNQMPMALYRQ